MKKVQMKYYYITIMVIISLFQRVFAQYYKMFSYYDEFIVMLFTIMFFFRLIKQKKIMKIDMYIICLIFALILIGIFGNITTKYVRASYLIMDGIIVWFKSFLLIVCSISFFSQEKMDCRKIIKKIVACTKVIVIMAFIGLIVGKFLGVWFENTNSRMRYGLHAYKFVYDNAAIFSWYCIAYMLIFTFNESINEEKKKNLVYLILTSIIWFFTLRSRAFVYITCYWIIYLILFKLDRNKIPKIKKRYLIFIAIIAIGIAIPAIQKYFLNSDTSRAILLKTGIKIAKENFPFGVGFANYGTSASYIKSYSALYHDLGFDKIYALRYNEGGITELADCYWPAVLGEMGWIGLVLFIVMFLIIAKKLIRNAKTSKWTYLATVFFMITSIFSSMVTGVFSSDAMISYILIVSIGINIIKRGEKSGEDT